MRNSLSSPELYLTNKKWADFSLRKQSDVYVIRTECLCVSDEKHLYFILFYFTSCWFEGIYYSTVSFLKDK